MVAGENRVFRAHGQKAISYHFTELVAIEAAREVYKVVIDPATREIDREETRRLRVKMESSSQ